MDISGYNIISEELMNVYVIQAEKCRAKIDEKKNNSNRDGESATDSIADRCSKLFMKDVISNDVGNKQTEQELFYNDPNAKEEGINVSSCLAEYPVSVTTHHHDFGSHNDKIELTDSNIDTESFGNCHNPTNSKTNFNSTEKEHKQLCLKDSNLSNEKGSLFPSSSLQITKFQSLNLISSKPAMSSDDFRVIKTTSEENEIEDVECSISDKTKKIEKINDLCPEGTELKLENEKSDASVNPSHLNYSSSSEGSSFSNREECFVKKQGFDSNMVKSRGSFIESIVSSEHFITPMTSFCKDMETCDTKVLDKKPADPASTFIHEELSSEQCPAEKEGMYCVQCKIKADSDNKSNEMDYDLVRSKKTVNMFSLYSEDQEKTSKTKQKITNDSVAPPMIFVLSDFILEKQNSKSGSMESFCYEEDGDGFSLFDLPPLFLEPLPDLPILFGSNAVEYREGCQENTQGIRNDCFDSYSSVSTELLPYETVNDKDGYFTEDEKGDIEKTNLYQVSIFDKIDLLTKKDEKESSNNKESLSEELLIDIMKEFMEY